jgi:hypothetical protein
LFRSTTISGGTATASYAVPGLEAALDEASFLAWRGANVPAGQENDLVAVLTVHEVLDDTGAIRSAALERRRGSASGPFRGEPARVTFEGAAEQVRLYHATRSGDLREVSPMLEPRRAPTVRQRPLVGDAGTIHALFGPAARIMDARETTLIEDMIGLATILHVLLPSGLEIDCGIGWHGTTPFVLCARFPRFAAAPIVPATVQANIVMAAVAAGLTTVETRHDTAGLAMIARSNRDGGFHLLRPEGDGARIEPFEPGVGISALNADQERWISYARTYEGRVALDAYRDGGSDNAFVFTGSQDGHVTRHLIDTDGVEVWRTAAEDSAAALLYHERVTGVQRG